MVDMECRLIEQNKNFSDLEWDKLSQNSFLVSLSHTPNLEPN